MMLSDLSDRYTLSGLLRKTSTAELYRGRRNSDGTAVVLKMLREEYPSPVDLARLRHEHSLLQSLQIPQVVRSLGLEQLGHRLALVLEDVGETSLEMLVQSQRLELPRALELAVALAHVVACVHRHHIVHKDIRPHHFFLRGSSSHVVLIDFGIATRL